MKNIVLGLMMMFVSTVALADNVYEVFYGQWTRVPYCGGETRLKCDEVSNARQKNRCYVEFRYVDRCDTVKLYVGGDFYPSRKTYESNMRNNFWVDDYKINHPFLSRPYFNVYLTDGYSNRTYAKLRYVFDY